MKRALVIAAVLATAAPAAARGGDAAAAPPPIGDTGGAAMLGKAQKAIDDIDYDAARTLTDQAIASGGLRPADLARAHMLAGEVAAAIGDDAGAHDHFERWILLAPGAALPAGLSPKITQPFTAAHASADALGPARFDVGVTRADGKVEIAITGDPLRMISRVHVHLEPGSDSEEVGARIELALDDHTAADATITLLDEHGNELVLRTAHVPAIEGGAALAPGPRVSHSIPGPLRWPTWAAVTVVAAGACGYFAHARSQDQSDLDALNAASAMHTFDEARAIEDRGNRDALLTNVTLGVAIAALAATVVTLAVDHQVVEVQPLVAPDSAGASASIHF